MKATRWTPDEEAKAFTVLEKWKESDPTARITILTQLMTGIRYSELREEVVARAVGRDIVRDLGSGRVDDVERVFTYLAETTGQMINETTVSGALGVQRATLSRPLPLGSGLDN